MEKRRGIPIGSLPAMALLVGLDDRFIVCLSFPYPRIGRESFACWSARQFAVPIYHGCLRHQPASGPRLFRHRHFNKGELPITPFVE